MSNIKIFNDDLVINTRSGLIHAIEPENEEIKNYAVVMMCGHCGVGYFLPSLYVFTARSTQEALEIAKTLRRVKKTNKNKVLALAEIDRITSRVLGYINHNDNNYYAHVHSSKIPDLEERRIPLPEKVQQDDSEDCSREQIQKDSVKTADQYDKKYVLQRFCAPSRYGDQLVYPKNINMNQLIEEYIHESTLNLGIKQRKVLSLVYYYQKYGENNDLGVRYSDGKMFYKNLKGKVEFLNVPKPSIPYLEEAKEKFLAKQQEEKANTEKLQSMAKPGISSVERFNRRYKKHLEMKDPTIKE